MKYFVIILSLLVAQFSFSVPPDVVKHLSLTDDQIIKINKIIDGNEAKKTDLKIKLQIKQLELRQLLLENEVNPDLVKAKLDEISKIETDLRFSYLLQDIEISKLLSSEQKDKYKSLRAKMKNFSDFPSVNEKDKKKP